ncbi:hypothetical protein [Tropicimonas sp. IMCC6043]|uniref:hypothetical protein n=1 Tax=Tropicimonas sp. IMCC6043 TaxID=2510645 RepID=UPI00101B5B86|nr:hypothetical protein [Tropicimonas sp. IMCC6043]RYH09741.1 hypothetical protein EU800_10890 [Tropicimonas sp. IMCC6043]
MERSLDGDSVSMNARAKDILRHTADELRDLSRELRAFECDPSFILEQAHVSPQQITRLQFLDETTQILEDLSRAVSVVENLQPASLACGLSELRGCIVLGDLRGRLCGQATEETGHPGKESGNVSFF